jgi:hypothetical protein
MDSLLVGYNWTNDANRGKTGPECPDSAVAERIRAVGHVRRQPVAIFVAPLTLLNY